jgi:hypothetical protein
MDAKELNKRQQEIWKEMEKLAKELENGNRLPIYDGVCDLDGYLSSKPKIMWILKEPNGQTEKGIEKGGWAIPEESFTNLEETAGQPTWQVMIYVMYGYQNGLKYDDMDYIHNKIEMAKVMQSIAYLNVSKMPGYNKSVKSNIEQRYTQWKPILNKQIETYAPNLIIFGNTFDHFKNDFKIRGLEKIGNIPGWIDVYKSGQLIILDAYHPSRKGRDYVNTLIEALNLYPQ